MKTYERSTVAKQLADYGYGLDAGDQITRRGEARGVFLTVKRARIQARMSSGALLWSGPDVGEFLEKFWSATRV